jgi:diaminohydroxyphosphoribosylaminopyrimidine deaminase / 5-amino-6-(5-phosphoribosylamino)uracil reductase
MSDHDEHWMRAAMEWARRGQGWTSPRPSVGCVIVQNGRVLGGGHTQPGHGNPHAEVMALRAAREAGEELRGATAYVTLEPCCHYATTPPCTFALIEAGIARVVCGVGDPNPAVNGQGIEQLRAAGVEVRPNFMADECARLHEQFLFHITQNRPFVTLKAAVSLDGKIAHSSGQSQWITGKAARRRAHQLRHEHDAILIGIGTALADDPSLTVRLESAAKQPVRVVLDAWGRLSRGSKLLRTLESGPVVVAVDEELPHDREARLIEAGAQVWRLPAPGGNVDLPSLLRKLYEREWCSLLVEGGAGVAGAFLQAKLVNKAAFFVAPLLIGRGLSVSGSFAVESLNAAPRLRDVQTERLGDDVLITGYL